MRSDYDRLIERLDAFIRKYYANRLLRGALLLSICLLFYILAVTVGEYFLYMSVWLRVTLIVLFIALAAGSLVWLVIIPALQMARLGKVISHEQAAVIIGKHFPAISDKLLNILQLKRQTGAGESIELAEASIDQKARQLSVVPFTKAVDLSRNRRYLPILLPLFLVGLFLLLAAPNVFRDASERLLQPTKTFEKPAPFRFVVRSMPLRALRSGDFVLEVAAEGRALPERMSLALGEERIPMSAVGAHVFRYTFRNLTEPVSFRLYAAGFYSGPYTLEVIRRPELQSFRILLDYPDYTGREDEELSSLGDMTLPAGTQVQWAFMAVHTDRAAIRFRDGEPIPLAQTGALFGFRNRFLNDTSYTLLLQQDASGYVDSYQYQVQIIPDMYPVVQLQEFRDTVTGKQILLSGTAGDDYGISRVLFRYEISEGNGRPLVANSVPLKVSGGVLTPFQHYFDVEAFGLRPGQRLSYYIEAWDNDGVQGSKASRSEVMVYAMYNAAQTDSVINASAQQISAGISSSAEQTKKLQDQYQELQRRMLQGNNNNEWEQTQQFRELMQQQLELKNQVEQVRKRFEEQMQQSRQKEYSEDIRAKQEALKEQLDNLVDKQLQEQMRQLQELMQQLNKDQAFKAMQQLQQENKLFNMDMQRMRELMKQLEMQMRLEDMAGKMDKLAEQQQQLRQQTEKGSSEDSRLAREQQELKEQLDKAMNEDMKSLEELNKEMRNPQDLAGPKEEGKSAQQQMDRSKQSLSQGEKSKASESQSKAAQHMQQMAEMMRQQAGGMNLQQIDMDIRATRQILTNLMRLSFDQEQLMKNVHRISPESRQYLDNMREQQRLRQNARMIRDSLFVLSRRVFQLAATVNKETTELEKHMGNTITALENRRTGDALTRQQYVMTHANNLALMLNELLSNLMQMQNEAQGQQAGSCSSPGGAKPKPGPGQQLGDIITGQQQLGNALEQMEQARQRGQKGQQPGGAGQQGGQQGGEEGAEGEYGNSEQLARLAQQQAALRRQLQELSSILNSKGAANTRELQELQQQMDRNETDLVNRRLSSETLRRQREILTRLLETEKSLREQEEDDKRSSRSPEELSRPVPPELQQRLQQRQQLLELYRTAPPQLRPYYRKMVESYYRIIGTAL
jgi:hypothetical protein